LFTSSGRTQNKSTRAAVLRLADVIRLTKTYGTSIEAHLAMTNFTSIVWEARYIRLIPKTNEFNIGRLKIQQLKSITDVCKVDDKKKMDVSLNNATEMGGETGTAVGWKILRNTDAAEGSSLIVGAWLD